MPHRLDETDRRILKELMDDGRLTNVALAARVGITPPPCLRRVRVLEEQGFITRYTTEVDARRLGFEVTAFVMVTLHSQAESDLRDFENRVLAWPMVREAHIISGETDFLLRCVAKDLTSFQDFIMRQLTSAPNVSSIRTQLAIRRAKFAPGLPIEIASD